MNDTTFTIGRSAENHLVVDSPCVSRRHARVTFITDHVVLLEDNDSTYGTFVDGRRVARTVIGVESRIVLGQDTPVDPQRIFSLKHALPLAYAQPRPVKLTAPHSDWEKPELAGLDVSVTPPKTDPLDFTAEFKRLATMQETYTTAREAIQINSPRHQAWLRASFGLTPLIGLAFGPMGIMMSVLGAAIGQIVAAEFLNPSEKLLALDKEFKRTYVCPSCGVFLGNVSYADLVRRRQCRECKARWVD